MKIRALRFTSASGTQLIPGQVVDVSDSDAALLIQMGKAARFVAPPVAAPVLLPPGPVIETASIAPNKGATRKKAHH